MGPELPVESKFRVCFQKEAPRIPTNSPGVVVRGEAKIMAGEESLRTPPHVEIPPACPP